MESRSAQQQHLPRLIELALIGQGRTAEIFEWGQGQALRLYRSDASRTWVQRELHAFRLINEADIPSPAVYPFHSEDGLVEIEGRLGFVTDRIDGPTMLHLLTRRPWKLWSFARALAGAHLSMHRQTAQALPSQRERFKYVINQLADELGDETTLRLRNRLDQLGDGNAVCHGDFHPDNIILSDRGPIIIDWGPATVGAPAADVAWTVYLFKHGGCPPGMARWQRGMLTILRRLFLAIYRRAYSRGAAFSWNEVERWGPVIAAIRLGDGIPEERENLLRILLKEYS